MRCTHVEALLSRRLDGPLPDDENAAVERHLSGCPSCTETWTCLRQARAVARSLPAALPPAGLAARALAAAMEADRDEGAEDFLGTLFPVAWRFALACSVVAVGLGVDASLQGPRARPARVTDEDVVSAPLQQDPGELASLVLGGRP